MTKRQIVHSLFMRRCAERRLAAPLLYSDAAHRSSAPNNASADIAPMWPIGVTLLTLWTKWHAAPPRTERCQQCQQCQADI